MHVSAAAMQATSISPPHIEPPTIDPIALAVSKDDYRARLIETISRNVMAWIRWSGSERVKPNQARREE